MQLFESGGVFTSISLKNLKPMTLKNTLTLIALVVSIGAIAQSKKINKSFDGIKNIEINTASGDCDLVKSSNTAVAVEVTYSYDDDRFEAILEKDGSTLVLKEKFKTNSSGSGSSHWKVSIPDNLEVKFNSGSGDLNAKSISAEISSNVGSGDIELSSISGDFKGNTGSGEVNVEDYQGDLKVNTGSGDVTISNSKGDLKINLGSGEIDANRVEGAFSFNAGSGDISVRDATLTGSSSFNSGSGDAKVVLKSELKNNISINSGSGNATLDFNGLKIEGLITMKANKKNGEITAPFKFDSETEENNGNQTIMKKTAKIGNSDVEIKIATGSGRASIEK